VNDAVHIVLAATGPPSGSGPGAVVTQLLFFAAIFAIFYFLLIRPQQRQKRDRETMLGRVKKGDRVVTTGGMHGTVVGLTENTVSLKIADQVKVEFDRSSIGRVLEAPRDKDA
jgi:preprotein translocase subunit YajC